MTKKIRIGFIGAGQIAWQHLKNYKEMKDNVEVVAVADVNEAQLLKTAAEFDIKNTFRDFREMLKRDDLDAVDVCLHNNLHMPATTAALEAGKHVYCEKPMAGSFVDAEKMFSTARKLKRKLSIQFYNLFNMETRAAMALIMEGKLGKLYHGRVVGIRRQGRPFVDGYGSPAFVKKEFAAGGALFDGGVYSIAQMLYLLGNPEVDRISGKTYQETPIDQKRAISSGYDVEEMGLGFVKMASNISMDIIVAWAAFMDSNEGSCILGSQGGIRLNPFGFFHAMGDMQMDSRINLEALAYRWKSVREMGDGYDDAQRHWIAGLQGRVELLPTAELALNTMLISEGIYLSEKLDREVTAEEVRSMSVSTSLKI